MAKHVDLSSLDTSRGAEQGFTVALTSPGTGEPLDIEIDVMGADSDQYKDRSRDIQRRRQKAMEKARKLTFASPEEVEADVVELLVAVTTGWRNVEEGGKAVPFSGNAARELYRKYDWIREQVDAAINDRANFLPKAAKPS